MSNLLISLVLVVILFGVAVSIFQGENGVTNAVVDGHASILEQVRSFDYISD
jgi:hypothetical protein